MRILVSIFIIVLIVGIAGWVIHNSLPSVRNLKRLKKESLEIVNRCRNTQEKLRLMALADSMLFLTPMHSKEAISKVAKEETERYERLSEFLHDICKEVISFAQEVDINDSSWDLETHLRNVFYDRERDLKEIEYLTKLYEENKIDERNDEGILIHQV